MSDCCSPDSSTPFDLAVIGAGSAGFSAAITAADQGARVALIGEGMIGGTCVNVGCVPSKTMIRAMEAVHSAAAAQRFEGLEVSSRITDWGAVVRQKQALVEELRAAKYTEVLPNYNAISYMEGAAQFFDDGELSVAGKPIHARKTIIATGSRPHIPEIPGLGSVAFHDSTSILELETLPDSLIVMGGGYIGAELAQVFARPGVKVMIVSRRGLLPVAEPEIGAALTSYFEAEGIVVCSELQYEGVEQDGAGVALSIAGPAGKETLRAEALLLATGRVPNTQGLNLDAAGVRINGNGGIYIDAALLTSREGVYAVGDVTGRDQFVYMAAYGAKLAAKNALDGNTLSYDYSAIPAVVFSNPQVASVGMTEAQAVAAGHTVKTSVLPLEHVPRALAARDTRGLIKLVADGVTKRLLGAHILAPEGADSIQTATMAIRAGMTYVELGAMIFPYLTTVEGLKLAAQTFEQDVAKLSCCAG